MKPVKDMTEAEMDALIAAEEAKKRSLKDMTDDEINELYSKEQAKEYGEFETGARHAINSFIFGYEPQVEGGITAAGKAAMRGELPTEEEYIKERDAATEALAKGAEQNHLSAATGNIAGTVAQIALAPELLPAKAGSLAKAAASTASGIAQMIAQNPGDEKGKLDPWQAEQRAEQAQDPLGLALSAIPLGIHGVGKLINEAALINPAYKAAFKATKPSSKQFEKSLDNDAKKIKEIGKFALDEKLIRAGDSIENIYFRTRDYADDVGNKIGEFYDNNRQAIEAYIKKVNEGKIKDGFLSDLFFSIPAEKETMLQNLRRDLMGVEGKEKHIQRAEEYLDQLISEYGPNPDIKEMHKIKQKIQAQVRDWSKTPDQQLPMQNAFRSLSRAFSDAIEGELKLFENVIPKNQIDELRTLNKKYSIATEIEDNAAKAFSKKETSTDFMTPFMGSIGGMTGYAMSRDPLAVAASAAAGMAIPPILRTAGARTASTKAWGLDQIVNKQDSKVMLSPLRGYLGSQVPQEPMIEGYPQSQTQQVPAEQIFMMQNDISKSDLDNVEKARRMNLLNKHGLMYIGQ